MSEPITIKSIRAIPLYGKPFADWPHRFGELEQTRTLVEVLTNTGIASLGSVYTSAPLVEGALKLLRPLYEGASAIDPAATSEMLHQNTFWQGRGGAVTHAISGIDMALWDILGKVTGQPVHRLLGGKLRDRVKPYGIHAHGRTRRQMPNKPPRRHRPGLSRLQNRLGPVRPTRRCRRRSHRQSRTRSHRTRLRTHGGRRRSRRILAPRLQMGHQQESHARHCTTSLGSKSPSVPTT